MPHLRRVPWQTLTQAYKKELHKFDTQRVIVAWDGLMSKQQAALESLGVPAMYVTDLTVDREASVHHFRSRHRRQHIPDRRLSLKSDRNNNVLSGYLRAL